MHSLEAEPQGRGHRNLSKTYQCKAPNCACHPCLCQLLGCSVDSGSPLRIPIQPKYQTPYTPPWLTYVGSSFGIQLTSRCSLGNHVLPDLRKSRCLESLCLGQSTRIYGYLFSRPCFFELCQLHHHKLGQGCPLQGNKRPPLPSAT